MSETRRNFLKLAAGGFAVSAARSDAQQPQTIRDRQTDLRVKQSGEAVLACGGDWFLTRPLSTGATPETNAVFDVFRNADAGFVNLENGLSTTGSAGLGDFRYGAALRGDPALVSELAWGGIRAVSLANNHTGNFGREALLQTIATLEKAKIAHAGAGATLDQAIAPTFVTAGELIVAFFSVYTLYHEFGAADQATATEPGVSVCRAYDVMVQPQIGFDTSTFPTPPNIVALQSPSSQTIIAALRGDVERLKAAIRQAASRADVVLVSSHIHWGRHTKHDLPPNLRVFAQELIDAGADMFVGHGPHAIRGIEIYRGKPIVHSMGNLVLMPPSSTAGPRAPGPGHEGLLVRATVARRSVRALELLPIAMDVATGNPRFPSEEQTARTLGKLSGLSTALGLEIPVKAWFGNVKMD